MYQFSDSDSSDSEDGIRFKTDSTRNKKIKRKSPESSKRRHSSKHSRDRRKYRSRSKSGSPRRIRHKHERSRTSNSTEKDYSNSRKDKHEKLSRSNSREKKHESRNRNKDSNKKDESSSNKRHENKEEKRHKHKELSESRKEDKTKPSHLLSSKKVIAGNSSNEVVGPSVSLNNILENGSIDVEISNEIIVINSEEILGPSLPPHLIKKDEANTSVSCQVTNISVDKDNDDSPIIVLGPTLPVHLIQETNQTCGPSTIAENEKPSKEEIGLSLPEISTNANLEETCDLLGPALPPHLLSTVNKEDESENKERYIGPSLPIHIRKQLEESANSTLPVEEIIDLEDEDDTYGPLPADMMLNSKAHIALEERALQIKLDKLNPKDTKTAREEWMIELPTVQASNLGLGPRQFRAKAGPDLSDRTSWTDTPKDKEVKPEPKLDVKKEAELMEIQKRDDQQEEMSKKHKKKRDKSLLDIHQDKLKKIKKKDDEEGNVRRPFNREVDLKVNKFDDAQKKAIYKKAQLLDDRFSKGQSKFL